MLINFRKAFDDLEAMNYFRGASWFLEGVKTASMVQWIASEERNYKEFIPDMI